MRTIEFKGVKVGYDEKCVKSWKWQKAVASGDQSRAITAIEQLLCGRDEEYAEQLDDDADDMGALLQAVLQDMQGSKN